MNEPADSLSLYFKTLIGESERGKILLLTSKIDELLCELLKNFFKKHRKKEDDNKLFGSMGALGSLASRIEMAYRVGLISKATADCFDLLRQIRNECAHGLESFSVERGKYAKKFEEFKKHSFTISGMSTFFELVERVGTAQDPSSKELVFLVLTMIHMLLLQSTLKNLRRSADSFCDLETVNVLPSELGHILTSPPNKVASK